MNCLRSRSLALAALAATLAAAAPAHAEFLVFHDGRAMKVSRYEFAGDATRVELPGGGRMQFESAVVSHVAPDEDLVPPPAPVTAVSAALVPGGDAWLTYADPRFVEPIERHARGRGLDPALIAAVIKVESNFHPHAVSPKGAKGLMQLMPGTAKDNGVADPFDPEANIAAGVRHLGGLLERYRGDLTLALAAYNAGQRAVDRAKGIPDFAETRAYVARVLAIAQR